MSDAKSGLRLSGTEPAVERWQSMGVSDVATVITADSGPGTFVIAVDGRSGGGKSTFAASLAGTLDAALLSTDDFAWWHSMFDWTDVIIEHGLGPLREGHEVDFRPPAWIERGREGSISAPARRFVVVEGVGAGQVRMRPAVDTVVWIQSDEVEAERRGLDRDLVERPDPTDAKRFWDSWMDQEGPFQEVQQTWRVASLIVCGTPGVLGLDPAPGWLCAPGPAAGGRWA